MPAIYPDDEFLNVINSSRYPYMPDKSLENFSHHITALDGGKVCLVSWDNKIVRRSFECYTSYATLTFFKVTSHEGRSHNIDYANEKVDGMYLVRRCFKAKLHANVKADENYGFKRFFKSQLV